MNPQLRNDREILAAFTVEEDSDGKVVTLKCKRLKADGEPCGKTWDCDLKVTTWDSHSHYEAPDAGDVTDKDTTVISKALYKGDRTALMQHVKAHDVRATMRRRV